MQFLVNSDYNITYLYNQKIFFFLEADERKLSVLSGHEKVQTAGQLMQTVQTQYK